ncbi:hypothetical protein AB8896_04770 [Yersinia enterocolitica]|uniref:ORC-CDC6 family AAA ATPase n=1 Tax=Yersinia enterocolitica TaxID=630 RepID=UPI0036D6C5CB
MKTGPTYSKGNSMDERKLSELFAKNRAEELPDDIWGTYVLPINYPDVDLRQWTKACVIVGGRGSGKTMFLKYHCHPTIFSSKHNKINNTELKRIGIYWRPDTAFTQHLSEEWLGKYWDGAFKSYMCLSILIEFSRLAKNISVSKIQDENLKYDISKFKVPKAISKKISQFTDDILLVDAEEYIQEALFELSNWINIPDKEIPPINIDIKSALSILSIELNKLSLNLKDTIYHIYIDEFENLTIPQQKLINTWMKHGIQPLLFSVAYKKNADVSHNTISQESIVERNDYRKIDLEETYLADFGLFAAEVLALKLTSFSFESEIKTIINHYSDPRYLDRRKGEDYQKAVRKIASDFLPNKSYAEIAKDIWDNKTLASKAFNLINDGLVYHKDTQYNTYDFIDYDKPEASLVNGVLLNRKSNIPKELIIEFTKYRSGKESKYPSWIQNNLVGTILYIYNKVSSKPCPLYSGFEQFILMSTGNLRHFLELCHQSILKTESDRNNTINSILNGLPVETQSSATIKTSTLEIEKISDLGANGIHLKRIARRLGKIFNYSQLRKSQSEPEVNHFTFDLSDHTQLDDKTRVLLNEALVWSVLFEEKSTKKKSEEELETKDYILHPVLSSYFGISYRRKRKLKIKIEELKIIFQGDDDEFNKLLKTFKSKWSISEDIDESYKLKDGIGMQLGLI